MQYKILNEIDKDIWNEKAVHPIQSYEWGELKKTQNIEIIYIGGFDDNNKLNKVFLGTLHPLPILRKRVLYFALCDVPDKNLIEFLKSIKKRLNLFQAKFEPYFFGEINYDEIDKDIVISGERNFFEWTNIVEIKNTSEEQLKTLGSTWRYDIKTAQKQNVRVSILEERNLKEFTDLLAQTSERQKFGARDNEYHKNLFKIFNYPKSFGLIASLEEEIFAVATFLVFKKTLFYIYAGSNPKFREFQGPKLILFSALEKARELNLKFLDFWGVSAPDDKTNSLVGISIFKRGMKGQDKRLAPAIDLIFNPFIYKLFKLGYRIKKRK